MTEPSDRRPPWPARIAGITLEVVCAASVVGVALTVWIRRRVPRPGVPDAVSGGAAVDAALPRRVGLCGPVAAGMDGGACRSGGCRLRVRVERRPRCRVLVWRCALRRLCRGLLAWLISLPARALARLGEGVGMLVVGLAALIVPALLLMALGLVIWHLGASALDGLW